VLTLCKIKENILPVVSSRARTVQAKGRNVFSAKGKGFQVLSSGNYAAEVVAVRG
jgi:hypothetical protein